VVVAGPPIHVPLDGIKIVDADTHVIEPADLWTSRLSVKRWGDLIPQVRWDEDHDEEAWFFGGQRIQGAGASAMAGWPEFPPRHPRRMADVDPAATDPVQRLRHMDDDGIYAQVLYPNVGGFGAGRFTELGEPQLMLECVRAYNDYLTEWTSADSNRLVPTMAIPFWDLQVTCSEIERALANGHKGIVMSSAPQTFGLPVLADHHWDPLWAVAQEAGLSINFHIGSGVNTSKQMAESEMLPAGRQANYAWNCVQFFLGNARTISTVIMSGICHRFPQLNFVSVESGIGWLPFLVEAMDWQWLNNGVAIDHPEWNLLPSEYFKRQVFGCFWFEEASALATIDVLGPDNFLFETDFPHPTSMSPGPASTAVAPLTYVESNFGNLPRDTLQKVLHDNAARLYHLD